MGGTADIGNVADPVVKTKIDSMSSCRGGDGLKCFFTVFPLSCRCVVDMSGLEESRRLCNME